MDIIDDIMRRLRDAKYPTQYVVTAEEQTAVEDYLCALGRQRIAAWRASGSPDTWPVDLWPMYRGPHFGPMLKGVELVTA